MESRRAHFGSVRKRASGRWEASYWHLGRRHTGPTTFAAKADAQAWLATVEADILRAAWVDPAGGKTTVREYADRWLGNRPDLSPTTAARYRSALDVHVLPALGDIPLASLTPSRVRSWHGALARKSQGTAAKCYRTLSTLINTAVRDGLIMASPCRVVGGGSDRSAERPIATVAEIGALVEAMPERIRAIVLFAAWCQLRRGEILALRRRDLDLVHRTVHVGRSFVYLQDGRVVAKEPKTAAGRRTVAIPGNVVAALTDHLARHVRPEPDALLFTGERSGDPLRPHVLANTWRDARVAIGRQDFRLHDLRHTGLSLAAATGATTAELMHRAGHASPAAALRYQHASQNRDRVLADALAELGRLEPVVPISRRS